MLEHGGQLVAAAHYYQIPIERWIDLSTGINPNGWPIPPIPAECWQRLPETGDGLLEAAQRYYQCSSLLPVAGSQAAIQALPLLRPPSLCGLLEPAYAEHAANWKQAGHTLLPLSSDSIEDHIDTLDVLILINPNNPTGCRFDRAQLVSWHRKLQSRKGWLIVDEAFIDSRPDSSLAPLLPQPGLIVLRSLGKFFGLAGARCGFVLAEAALLDALNERLGPWTISHPSRFIATQALSDTGWQQQTRMDLEQQADRLARLLTRHGLEPDGQTDLFAWIKTDRAQTIHRGLAQQGVLTRLFTEPASLRFGLPKDECQWRRLESVLCSVRSSRDMPK
ncbi:MAG: threonine-phosphate decarboxylase CobD [Gammaproteobacteria bacterium]